VETLGAFLDSLAERFGRREAIAYAPRDAVTSRMTFAGLRAQARVAAKRLHAAGVSRGTRVGLLCSNRMEWLPVAFGAWRLGAVLVPLSTLWKRHELDYGLRHAAVEVLLTLPGFLSHDYLAHVRALWARLPALRRVALLEGHADDAERWDHLPAGLADDALAALEAGVAATDRAVVFYTSGTTAQAKAVVHRHDALVVSARRLADCLGIDGGDAWWGHMPLFWSGGLVLGALATLAGGGRVVLQELVEPGAALALLEAEGCTVMLGWHQAGPLLDHPDFAHRRLRLKKGSGGTHPLATRLLGPDHASVGMYGMTETATCVTSGRWDDPEEIRTGSFGRPLAGMEVRIVDPATRAAVPPGAEGEILVRGPTLMEEYLGVPRAETFDAEGFFRTGDLGFFDARGCLHFASRLKDVIKTAGVNVAASEVEEALARHPAVKEAHVVGVADAVRGENIAAFVVLHDGAATSAPELQAFCKAGLASYKVPRHVFFLPDGAVPRTGSGKVEKAALKAEAAKRVGSSRG
jgi:fatty-acyl-CoA synthase